MANRTIRTLMVVALAGTTLSGCSLVGSVAGTAWGGTKTVAKWVSSPVRYVLRGTPEAETEFVGVETETELAEVETESAEIRMAESVNVKRVEAEPFTTHVANVSENSVVAIEPIMTNAQTSVSTSTTYQSTSTYNVAAAEAFSSKSHYSIQTTNGSGNIHFVRLQGESNMADWMGCNTSANGYWITSSTGGNINPEFEVCMRNMDYVLKTELDSYDTADVVEQQVELSQKTAEVSSEMIESMAGSAKSTQTETSIKSAYAALPTAQTSALPDKF